MTIHKRIISCLFAAAFSFGIVGCGWHLAGTQSKPASLDGPVDALSVVTHAQNRKFNIALEKAAEQQHLPLEQTASTKLVIQRIKYEKQPLAYSRTGDPVQYQMDVHVYYNFQRAGADLPTNTLVAAAHRQYDFQASALIAKKQEEDKLLLEMYREIAERILSSVKK